MRTSRRPKRNPEAEPPYADLVRVSSKGQHDRDTPEVQRRALDELRKRRPGKFVERIEHEVNLSGRLSFSERPDLQRLSALAASGALNGGEIRVFNIDRLTRAKDLRERATVFGIAKDANAIIVDTRGKEIDPNSDYGEIQFVFDTKATADEIEKILGRTLGGRLVAASEGQKPSGPTPFGLTYNPKTTQWGIDDQRSAVVLRMYKQADEGASVKQICNSLNAEGIASPRGNGWSLSSVKRVLRHRVYRGEYTFTFNSSKLEEHDLPIENREFSIKVPQIVAPELWDRVQAGLASRRNKPVGMATSLPALIRLRGICGQCGSPLHVWRTARIGTYYRCSSVATNGPDRQCDNGYHRQGLVDEAVWAMVVKELRNPQILRDAAGRKKNSTDSWESQITNCEKRIAQIAKEQSVTLRLVTKGLAGDDGEKMLLDFKKQRETLERTIEVARRAIADREHASEVLSNLDSRLADLRSKIDSEDFETRRALFLAVVPLGEGSVTVYKDGRIEMQGIFFGGVSGKQHESLGRRGGHIVKVDRSSRNMTQLNHHPGVPFRLTTRYQLPS